VAFLRYQRGEVVIGGLRLALTTIMDGPEAPSSADLRSSKPFNVTAGMPKLSASLAKSGRVRSTPLMVWFAICWS
jgi:hypothetical protein